MNKIDVSKTSEQVIGPSLVFENWCEQNDGQYNYKTEDGYDFGAEICRLDDTKINLIENTYESYYETKYDKILHVKTGTSSERAASTMTNVDSLEVGGNKLVATSGDMVLDVEVE